MATGGGFDESFNIASDEYHDVPCSPCDKGKRNVPASHFCMDCNQAMCQNCLKDHNKFDIMKGHQTKDIKSVSTDRLKQFSTSLPTLRCRKHGGKLLEVLCKNHDEPCCTVCASIDHSSCEEKVFIPKAVEELAWKTKTKSVTDSADEAVAKLTAKKENKKADLERVENQQMSILSQIETRRKMIDKRIDAMEADLRKKVGEKFGYISGKLENDIEKLDDALDGISGRLGQLAEVDGNESDVFVLTKLIEGNIREVRNLEENSGGTEKNLYLVEPSEVFGEVTNLFGSLSGEGGVESVVDAGSYNIRSPGDQVTCCITDCCIMNDGSLVLLDLRNRNLKHMDRGYVLRQTFPLKRKPSSLCRVNETEVAVAILNDKSVQIISVKEPMSMKRSIKVGESCRGMICKKGFLYMSCGGMKEFGDGPGEIRVYCESRGFLCKIPEHISVPKRMTVDKSGDIIYLADQQNGVVSIDSQPVARRVYNDSDLVDPIAVCHVGKGELLVCGYESHNVLLVSETGTRIAELISKKDGVVNPKCMCLDKSEQKLIIGMDNSDNIKVFSIVRK